MAAPDAGEPVTVGEFKGVWGTRGWVKVYSYTQPAEAVFEYQPWTLEASGAFLRVAEWRRQGRRLVARLEGLDDPDQAMALTGKTFTIPRSKLPEPAKGEFYWSDLVGLQVVNQQGHEYGKITGLIETGANDVLEVRSESGDTVLLPFVIGQYVIDVDLAAGRMLVDYPVEWLAD